MSVFDIKQFNYGIISSVDAEDIPPESASDSLNIDGDVGEGKLQGIPLDLEYQTSGSTALTNVKLGEFIEDAGVYYFVYFDDSDDKLKVIRDFYGTKIKEEITKYTSSLTAFTLYTGLTFTKEGNTIRIANSNGEMIWVGIPKHKQFGLTDYTSGFNGSGLDDMTANISGYTGVKTTYYKIIINSTGAHDTITITKENGTPSAPINIPGANYNIGDGVTITFGAITGHTVNDEWIIIVDGVSVEKSELETRYGTTATYINLGQTEHSGTGYFQNNILYSWKYSLVYDGLQESPIGSSAIKISDVSSGADYYTIKITAEYGKTSLRLWNRRITGVNLYRAESSDGTESRLGLYRLIQSFDINDANWITAGDDRTLDIYDYGTYYSYSAGGTTYPTNPVTYSENTGIGETFSSTLVRSYLSTTGNGCRFLAKCYQDKIPDATKYIFKSKIFRHDIFDWTADFLIMPEAITAIHFYDGKLWAFATNKVFRVNPDGMYIEDVFDDAGCQGQRAVHSNEYGMFFANFQSAWMYQGGSFSKISDAIRQSTTSGKSWETFTNHEKNSNASTLTDLIITSDSLKGYVLFLNERYSASNKLFAWAYHPSKKRWDAFSFADYASSANAGIFKGKDGEIYLSYATATQKLMRNTGYQLWEWYSQELTFGETRQNKSITMIKVDATGTVALTYGVDGATPATSGTSDALINTYAKSLRIKLNAASGTNYVDSLEIVYRPLIGAR